ncbi:MAG TPA: enoyl-CoA hydratase [Dehalococcoidia bacterium]|nr:enoyl-CoA hydratase [Dehalococcoidia bacterium]
MSATVLLDLDQGVATLTLNRPDVLNSLTEEMLDALAARLDDCGGDDTVRAVVVTGAGRAFCAGQDLDSIKDQYGDGRRPDFKNLLRDHHHQVVERIVNLPKPVIAAINGVAAGAGMSFACACDLRVAADSARFTTAFTKIGLIPDGGLAYTLPRLVGFGRAVELVLLSEMIPADEALRIGLVNRVVPADELPVAARQVATQLAAGPTAAYGYAKQMLKEAMLPSQQPVLADLLRLEAEYQAKAGNTEDHARAVQAFLNKEQATFSGR